MRCTYYLPFEDKQGNALLRANNGQRLNLAGKPPVRRYDIPGTVLGRGLEFGEEKTNLISNSMYNRLSGSDFSWSANASYKLVNGGLFGRNKRCGQVTIASGSGTGATTAGFALRYASWTASTEYTASVYYRILQDGGSTWRGYITGNQGFGTHSLIADGKWHRFVATNTKNTSTGSEGIRIYNYGNTLTSNAVIQFDGYQMELGKPSPFNSNGRTVRNPQYASIPTKGIMPTEDGGTFYMVLRPDWAYNQVFAANPVFLSLWSASDEYWNIGYSHTTDEFRFVTRNSTSWSYIEKAAHSFGVGDRILIIGTWNGTTANLYINGVEAETGALTQYSMRWPSQMILGSDYDFTKQANGVVEEFAIFDEPMTELSISRIYENVTTKGLKLQDVGMI